MKRLITIHTEKTIETEKEFEKWTEIMQSMNILSHHDMEKLQETGEVSITTTSSGYGKTTYQIQKVN